MFLSTTIILITHKKYIKMITHPKTHKISKNHSNITTKSKTKLKTQHTKFNPKKTFQFQMYRKKHFFFILPKKKNTKCTHKFHQKIYKTKKTQKLYSHGLQYRTQKI